MVFLGFFLFFCFFLCFCAEFHLRIDESFASLVLFLIRSIRLKQMCLYIVTEFQIQDVLDLFLDLLILYRNTISTRRSRFRGIQSALPM